MINRFLLLLAFISLTFNSSHGQNMYGQVNKPINKDQNLGGGDIVNVDLFTGTGLVNIPIYDYKLVGLDLGVSLNYNAKGIKVDQKASSVGLGWSLNAGGFIIRSARGIEDEVTTPAEYNTQSGTDYFEGCLVPGAVFNTWGGAYDVDDQEHDIFYLDLCGRQLSLQFYYDGNDDLKYITYPKSEILVEPITKNMTAPTSSTMTYGYTASWNGIINGIGMDDYDKVLSFKITDEKGNVFYFERGDFEFKDFEYVNPDLSVNSGIYYATDKWDLVKIETVSGLDVNYEYVRTYIEELESIQEKLDRSVWYEDTGTIPNVALKTDPIEVKKNYWKGYKTHISKISYPNGVTVTFNVEFDNQTSPSVNISRCDCAGDFRLWTIDVENGYDNNLKNSYKYILRQAFFNTPKWGLSGTEIAYNDDCVVAPMSFSAPSYRNFDSMLSAHWERGTRLKLKGIDKYGTDGNTLEKLYDFVYNDEPLPYRFASQKDYYGYYNGPNSTKPLITGNFEYRNNHSSGFPEYDTFYYSLPLREYGNSYPSFSTEARTFGTNRENDYEYAQAWILDTIKNGQGGRYTIEYDDYTLTNPDSQYYYIAPVMPSGTETKWDIDDDSLEGETVNDGLCVKKVINSDIYSTEHVVTTEYSYSEGQRFNRGGYTWYQNVSGKQVFMNFFVSPDVYYHGSNHGFSSVVRTVKGFNNEQLSKTRYSFTNLRFDDGVKTCMYRRTGLYFHTFPGQLSIYKMGNLLSVEKFDVSNNLTSKSTYEYEYIDHTPASVSSTKIGLKSLKNFQGPSIPDMNHTYWTPGGIVHEEFYPINYHFTRLKTKKDSFYTYYGATRNTLSLQTDIYYDQYNNPITVKNKDSKGDEYKTHTWYNETYHLAFWQSIPVQTLPTLSITTMTSSNLQYPISTETWKMLGSTDSVLLDFKLIAPITYGNGYRFPATFSSSIKDPLASTDVFPALTSTKIKRKPAAYFSGNTSETDFGTNLRLASLTTLYDDVGNALEVLTDDRKSVTSNIWDTRIGEKLATVENASYEDIAFTSFEGGTTFKAWGVSDYNKGNWEFDPNYIAFYTSMFTQKAMTGKYAYSLEPGNSIIKSQPLNEKEYILTFWAAGDQNSSPPEVELFNNTTSKGNISYTEQNAVGDWKLYTAKFTPDDGDHIEIYNVTGTQTYEYYIDELRLHPADAVMVSNTYEPLIGASSTNNASNIITYTEYDVMGRYHITRDMHGNVVKKIESKFSDPD